nr:hypothetical protein [Tanacetum cinerariifolium]
MVVPRNYNPKGERFLIASRFPTPPLACAFFSLRATETEIKFLLYQGEDSDFKDSVDQSVLTHYDDLFVDPTPEMFSDEQPPDYSFPPIFDVYPDYFLEIKSDATFDDDSFDSEGEKIKEAELLIDQLDLPCDILSEYDSLLLITRTRSSSKLAYDQTSNPTSSTNPTPKGRIRRSSKQKDENSHFEEHLTLVATMADNRTMAEILRAPTEGCAEAIVVPPIL